MKWLVQRPLAQALLTALLGRYLALALRTTRWTVDGAEHLAAQIGGAGGIVAFWHERLPLMPALLLYGRAHGAPARVHVLVSRHRDGRFIGEVVRRFSLDIVHGSSLKQGRDRGGAASARTLLSVLAEGAVVAITPDGPRGPRRKAASGVAQIAAVSGVVVVPCAAQTSHRWTLSTWDRMVLPLPFGRGVIVCRPGIAVPREDGTAALPAIEAAMTEAADRADRLCG